MPRQVAPSGAYLDHPLPSAQVLGQGNDRLLRPECEPASPLAPIQEAREGVRVGDDFLQLGEARQAAAGVELLQRFERQAAPADRLTRTEEVERLLAQLQQLLASAQNRLSCLGGSGETTAVGGGSSSARIAGSLAMSSSSVFRNVGW